MRVRRVFALIFIMLSTPAVFSAKIIWKEPCGVGDPGYGEVNGLAKFLVDYVFEIDAPALDSLEKTYNFLTSCYKSSSEYCSLNFLKSQIQERYYYDKQRTRWDTDKIYFFKSSGKCYKAARIEGKTYRMREHIIHSFSILNYITDIVGFEVFENTGKIRRSIIIVPTILTKAYFYVKKYPNQKVPDTNYEDIMWLHAFNYLDLKGGVVGLAKGYTVHTSKEFILPKIFPDIQERGWYSELDIIFGFDYTPVQLSRIIRKVDDNKYVVIDFFYLSESKRIAFIVISAADNYTVYFPFRVSEDKYKELYKNWDYQNSTKESYEYGKEHAYNGRESGYETAKQATDYYTSSSDSDSSSGSSTVGIIGALLWYGFLIFAVIAALAGMH